MATGQLADPAGFRDIITSYRLGGPIVAVFIAGILVIGEAAAGIGLVLGDPARRRTAATIAFAVALAWTTLGVQAFVRGVALDNCGCFGVYAGQPLRWWVLVEDVELIALVLWVRRGTALGATFRSRGRPSSDEIDDHRRGLELEHHGAT